VYEARHHPPISRRRFARRMVAHVAVAAVFLVVSLAIGMAGYAYFEHLAWRDAFLNAAMLMGGMGPVETVRTPGGKVFAGLYALYCGLGVLIAFAILVAPALHRLLHKFHWRADHSG
jgi:ABC-type glycerol-3-phosphate transport system permease component